MKIIKYILIFFLFFTYLYSQKSGFKKIDSLIKSLNKSIEDTNKVNTLYKLSTIYYTINPDSGIIFGNYSLELSQKIKWGIGIIKSYIILGVNYWTISDYESATRYYLKALHIADSINNTSLKKNILINLAIIYEEQGNYSKSLEYNFQSLKICEQAKDTNDIPIILGNIGTLYHELKLFEKARDFYYEAVAKYEISKSQRGIAMMLGNIGNTYLFEECYFQFLETYKFFTALEFYYYSLSIAKKIDYRRGISIMNGNIGNAYQKLGLYNRAEKYFQIALDQSKKINDQSGVAANLDNLGTNYFLKSKHITIEEDKNAALYKSVEYLNKSISMFESIGDLSSLSNSYFNISTAYSMLGNFRQAFDFYKKFKEVNDTIKSIESRKEIANLVAVRDNEIKSNQIKIQNLALDKQMTYIYIFIGTSISVALILGFIIYLYITKKRTNTLLAEKNQIISEANIELTTLNDELIVKNQEIQLANTIISEEKEKSDILLLNILPVTIAERLKRGEETIADYINEASVMFVDLCGFTNYSSNKSPSQIVDMLNDIFVKFDNISAKYGVEKIKTIGDCYMAASGIPIARIDHAENLAKMAWEVKDIMDNYETIEGDIIRARIGLHCGPVVAGVIGKQKFIYDLWGDTVNTASRMESTGVVGKIQISETFKNALKDCCSIKFVLRGEVNVKGKGIMTTYFIEKN